MTAVAASAAALLYVFYEPASTPSPTDVAESPADNAEDVATDQARAEPGEITPGSRLESLGEWIAGYTSRHGRFPAPDNPALPVTDRLSWLAALAVEEARLKDVQPQRDLAWDDPLNDRFVRRRIAEFQNPLFDEIVGAGGYPATHFAGVAGVGRDAARLPKEHGRAGIFGDDRITTIEDIHDGVADTMMVVGVQSELTSWAAHGRGTVRGLTAEPYINGPDGLGTGQADGMHVLMADGSVRFVSSDIDPVLMRRMAAMADGLPLDAEVPGEPGEISAPDPELADVMPAAEGPVVAANDPAASEPIEVPLAADEPWFNVEEALALPVLQFTQTDPIRAEILLRQLEELGGVPIDRSLVLASPDAARLDQPVAVSLADTTFGEILQAVVAELQMTFTTGPQGITLHPAPGGS